MLNRNKKRETDALEENEETDGNFFDENLTIEDIDESFLESFLNNDSAVPNMNEHDEHLFW